MYIYIYTILFILVTKSAKLYYCFGIDIWIWYMRNVYHNSYYNIAVNETCLLLLFPFLSMFSCANIAFDTVNKHSICFYLCVYLSSNLATIRL